MSAVPKKPLPAGELHFAVKMRIDETAESLQRLTEKGILVFSDKATPTEHKLHLDYVDDKPTTIYVRLSALDPTKTDVHMSLSRGFYIPSKVYKALAGIVVFMVLEFLIHRSIEVSLLLFALVFVFAVRFSGLLVNSSTLIDQSLLNNSLARREADYVIDAVVELFKSKGTKILWE
jgi:hypothetical protein